ncbi:hypothetical protein GDO81_005555 [Engystomops pustulosus]|uniref:Secreted protein n=1 Tax=Engystomops pustulosus TaxID=76066 RepID=A0AAV7CPX7_ENGPU|nr:hypothetical protein GDO81_005555 [Engystomops pustulosus]
MESIHLACVLAVVVSYKLFLMAQWLEQIPCQAGALASIVTRAPSAWHLFSAFFCTYTSFLLQMEKLAGTYYAVYKMMLYMNTALVLKT